MSTVREDLVAALEMMVPLLQSFDNGCRKDRHGLCQSHFGEEHCSVVAARRAFTAAIDRAGAEPEEHCGCTGPDCPVWAAGCNYGYAAQRERVG